MCCPLIQAAVFACLGVGATLPSLGAAAADGKLPPASSRAVDFVKDVQPILVQNCYSCHGPDKQKSNLRWDEQASAVKGGDNGPAYIAGKSADSRVIKLVAGLDPETVMPPRGERLTAAQIGVLRAWIDQGATWPAVIAAKADPRRNHWAFKAPVRPPVPLVKEKQWPRNPLDNFILARLEKEHLRPSPEAERTALIRRLSLDLLGLPPTLKEVDAFVADREPDAYERLVERLLASPHYGERWGRHWLDVARYADTNGYEKDRPRSIWPYRDWVINAFNRDLPYDEFAIEQLAGDLLPNPTLEQRVATGFLRNAMLNQEGGIEPEQFRVEALIDRIDTLGKSFLGLTLNCCQCHDHKFDPFPQKDYYRLYAFLNNDDEAFLEVPTTEEAKRREEILGKIHGLEDKAMRETTNLTERMAAWEKSLAGPQVNWTVLPPKDWFNFATKYEKQDDLSLLGGGDLQTGGTMRVWVETALTNITGFRLEGLTNNNLMYGGPGQTGRGSFLVKEFTVEASPLDNPAITNKVKFRRALADAEAPGFSVTNAIDGKTDKGGWTPCVTPERRNQNHWAVFECEQPLGFPGGTRLLFTIYQSFDSETKLDCHMLGSLRVSATTDPAPLTVDPLSAAQRQWLAIPADQRSPEQQRELFNVFRLSDAAFAELNKEIDKAWADWPYPATTLVLRQRPQPRVTRVFKRGDRLRPDEEVKPAVPAVLHPFPPDAPRNRLGLAKWIAAPGSPTTARVIVNRLWLEYFGQGLVATPEDFGTRVETPSHPELLDWLACELMNPGVRIPGCGAETAARPWSLKHIHRLIVTSAAYRQCSRVTPDVYARDQFDRWLERAPRLRVESEVVQDIALSVSGLLNPKLGGPSVFPPIPDSVGDTAYGGFTWTETKGEDRYRRGLYTFWKRSLPYPSLTAFDAPSGETSCPRRVRSNTPLQALTTLNEKTFVQAAQALALRVLKEGGPDERARAVYAFRLCTARRPTSAELDELLKFWKEQYDHFENDTAAAVKVALPDPAHLPPDMNLHKVAAWAMVSRAILNLDETITKE
ncbi:MAG TPA: DUF1549 domain-containing protein [Candidatus Binatia bacterium]|nr:DUF1549 domain-containing protein [Candidatus Binatia bacterium]